VDQYSGERTIDIALVGSVACGTPSLAEQVPEAFIAVSTKIARPGHNYFLLRARGTSMNRSGINDGDLALIRCQATAEEGDKIVALINDDATIKHFHRDGDHVILRPHSTDRAHRPIVLDEEFLIQGVVAAVLPASAY
jgi:repressor LexA